MLSSTSIVRRIFAGFVLLAAATIWAGNEPSQGDPYRDVAFGRAERIVGNIELGAELAPALTELVAHQYMAIHRVDKMLETSLLAMEMLANKDGEFAERARAVLEETRDERVWDLHLAFVAQLEAMLDPAGIEAVKNGMTYGRMERDLGVFARMLPELTTEESRQIHAWLWEARERALCGGSSEQRHWWFDKFRGRINNYLSARGYDLKAAEQRLD